MPDEYWLIVEGPRFSKLPWPKKTVYFPKYCDYDLIVHFVTELRKGHPDWKINIGVTRGKDIHVLS